MNIKPTGTTPQSKSINQAQGHPQEQFSKDGKVNWKATTLKQWLGSTALGRLFGGGKSLQKIHRENTLDFMTQMFSNNPGIKGKYTDARIREGLEQVLHSREGNKLNKDLKAFKPVSHNDTNKISGALVKELTADPEGPTQKQVDSLIKMFSHLLKQEGEIAPQKLTFDELQSCAQKVIKDNPVIADKIKYSTKDTQLSFADKDSLFKGMSNETNKALLAKPITDYVAKNLDKTSSALPDSAGRLGSIVQKAIDLLPSIAEKLQSGKEATSLEKRLVMDKTTELLGMTKIDSSSEMDVSHFVHTRKNALAEKMTTTFKQFFPNVSGAEMSQLVSNTIDEDPELIGALNANQNLSFAQVKKLENQVSKKLEDLAAIPLNLGAEATMILVQKSIYEGLISDLQNKATALEVTPEELNSIVYNSKTISDRVKESQLPTKEDILQLNEELEIFAFNKKNQG